MAPEAAIEPGENNCVTRMLENCGNELVFLERDWYWDEN